MTTISRSIDDLNDLLQEQINFLKSSSIAFDNGCISEIKRLAVSVRILLHDTRNSTSLLALLNLKDKNFVDTSNPFDEHNQLSHSSLVSIAMTPKGAIPIPFLDEFAAFKRSIPFTKWWDGIVFVDEQRNEFSRKDIVLTLSNKEGGAHVDQSIDEEYLNLRKNNSLGWVTMLDNQQIPTEDQVPATMRQIAHEVLTSLEPSYTCTTSSPENTSVIMMSMSVFERGCAPPIGELHLKNHIKERPLINGVKIGRDDPCICNSGKKYKDCCM